MMKKGLDKVVDLFDINGVLETLSELLPYIYKKAVTSDSVYIKFGRIPHSLRISNHTGRSKYRYRWNLRSDILLIEINQNGYEMRFYPIDKLEKMKADMITYYEIKD